MKNDPAHYTKIVIRTEGQRVRVMWCNVRNIVKDEKPDVLERSYVNLGLALGDIRAWYEAKNA